MKPSVFSHTKRVLSAFAEPLRWWLLSPLAPKHLGLSFLSLSTLLLLLGFFSSFLAQILAVSVLFWLCLSVSWIDRAGHQEKKKLIEGMLGQEKVKWLPSQKQLTPLVKWSAHGFLLLSIVMILRSISSVWGKTLFSPAPQTMTAWGLYTIDLFCKATLFDIPEIYQVDLTKIQHVGFWGATLVFGVRLIILALIVSSVLRVKELFSLIERTVSMAQHNKELALTRLQMILELYPEQKKRICRWVHSPKWSDKETSREVMLEALGATKASYVLSVLLEPVLERETNCIQIAALKGMSFFEKGPHETLGLRLSAPLSNTDELPLFEQFCETLSAWGTTHCLELLEQTALHHSSEDVRLAAIRALGDSKSTSAVQMLADLMFSHQPSKRERFQAKDAILSIGAFSAEFCGQLQGQLTHSEHADNRRFAGIVLGSVEDHVSFELLAKRLHEEDDPHAVVYIIQGLSRIAFRMFEQLQGGTLQQLQKIAEFSKISAKYRVYSKLRSSITNDFSPIFVQIASIQALADLVGIWSIRDGKSPEEPEAQELLSFLKELTLHKDPQIADVARDTYERFPGTLKQKVDEEALGIRRDISTCVGVSSFEANELRASRPPVDLFEYRDDCVTCVISAPKHAEAGEENQSANNQALTHWLSGSSLPEKQQPVHFSSGAPSSQNEPSNDWYGKTIFDPSCIPLERDREGLKRPFLSDVWALLPAWVLARFRAVALVSQGRLATVFRVYDRVEKVEKALKVANESTHSNRLVVVHEIEALQACKSSGILPIIDAFPDLPRPAFTVPWVEQRTLFEEMVQRKRTGRTWHIDEVEGVIVPLCHHLEAMHQCGWFHGDIKPENIFYSEENIILYDMDAAREIRSREVVDTLSLPIGTPYYMAPEQVHRQATDRRVDIYSMGILIYELLAGSLPLGLAPPSVHSSRKELPASLDEVIQCATAYEPCNRYSTPQGFKLAFLSVLNEYDRSFDNILGVH